MELATLWEVYNQGKSKKLRIGIVKDDPTMEITRILRTPSDNTLSVYMRLRQSEEDIWSEEFLAAQYVNMPYSKLQMPKSFLEEGEIF